MRICNSKSSIFLPSTAPQRFLEHPIIMHFSFLTLIVALTTSVMSVGACQRNGEGCKKDSDCCDAHSYCVKNVSRTL
ncbi:hypothetical protein P692DRAFT_20131603 [Suillus brevipes Sb2]|nr:hypothetical protein P692DRAFT_20131603 [Suillus brevipes Sb2]